MTLSAASADLLASLPAALRNIAVLVVDEHGEVTARFGEPTLALPSAANRVEMALPDGGNLIVSLTGVAGADAGMLECLLRAVVEREQLEADMESMNSSSLQLLEQVSMLGETLPRLSAGESEAEIAATGLKALLVAASIERAIYVGFDPRTGLCDQIVYVAIDANGHPATSKADFDIVTSAQSGVLAQVIAAADVPVLCNVPAGGVLGAPGSPERLARSQVLGVAVSYGAGYDRVALGALLALDKRRSSYANITTMGSQEEQVVQSFAAMLGAVLGARKTAELGKELSLAQAIQEQILPEVAAQVAGFDLAGDYRTSGDVGGDYFDFVRLADGRTMAVIADVSGHNLASGMLMVSARATLRALAGLRDDPGVLFTDLAGGLFRDLTRTERFITAAAVALRPGDPTVEIVSAGHQDLLLYRAASGNVEALASDNTILGFVADADYQVLPATMQPGDCLLLYTDGVTEATASDKEMFGEARLVDVLQRAASGSARAVVDAVLAAVDKFTGASRGDDVTAVAIKAIGTAKIKTRLRTKSRTKGKRKAPAKRGGRR